MTDELVDPFAKAVENETPKQEESKEETKTVSDENPYEGKVVIFIKRDTSYASPGITVHAATAAEAKEALRNVVREELPEAVSMVADAFLKLAPAELPANPKRPAAEQPTSELPPGVPSINCDGHSKERKYVAKGTWAALFCQGTDDKDKQCPPLWRQKDGSYKAK